MLCAELLLHFISLIYVKSCVNILADTKLFIHSKHFKHSVDQYGTQIIGFSNLLEK